MAQRWLLELDTPGATVREAFLTFSERIGGLLDSPAARSLGSGPDAVRLADVVDTNAKLLVRLDPRYGQLARKLGAWMLVAMLRLAAELRQARWGGQCLFVVDEPRLLGHEGRHLTDLFGTARDAGLGLVVADQGIAGLAEIHPDLPDAVLRSTGWQMVMRQGSPADAEKVAPLFGTTWREDVSRSSDGRVTTRWRREPRVYPSWLMDLPTGAGWLRVAPTGSATRERIERVVTALPEAYALPKQLAPPPGEAKVSATGHQAPPDVASTVVDPERAAVEQLIGPADKDGCRRWKGSHDQDGYPRAWWRGGYRRSARLLFSWQRGQIPSGYTLDHICRHRWCVETEHVEPIPRAEHARREAARRRQNRAVPGSAVDPRSAD